MLTTDGRLCHGASPDACARCLPGHTATDFRLREVALRHLFGLVDAFIAPSRFLADRFIEWGLPAACVHVIANGIPAETPAAHRVSAGGRRDRFAFFGHINRFKGAMPLLRAAARLAADGVRHRLDLHGSSAFQTPEFMAEFQRLLDAAPSAAYHGPYERKLLARLIAEADWVVVPSLWWENAPLVIQEAQLHRRPVIAGDIGGMAEMVRHEVDGLLFHAGDVRALGDAMARAANDGPLWTRLVDGCPAPPTAAESAVAHLALYRALEAKPAPRPPRRRAALAGRRAA